MKKLFVIGIVSMMVMGLAVAGNAYVFQGVGGLDATGSNAAPTLTWGTNTSASSKDVSWQDTAGVLAIAGDQTWKPGNAVVWKYQYFVTAAPAHDIFSLGLWGAQNYPASDVFVKIWANSVVGLDLTKTYELKNAVTNQVYWTGKITGTSNKTAPLLSVSITAPKTANPNNDAMLVTFGATVPEPGSMLAMLSGLVGLVGFGIRRRK